MGKVDIPEEHSLIKIHDLNRRVQYGTNTARTFYHKAGACFSWEGHDPRFNL